MKPRKSLREAVIEDSPIPEYTPAEKEKAKEEFLDQHRQQSFMQEFLQQSRESLGYVVETTTEKLKNTKETASKNIEEAAKVVSESKDAVAAPFKFVYDMASQSTEELRNTAEKLLAQNNKEMAFAYFSVIKERGEDLGNQFSGPIKTEYLCDVIIRNSPEWLKNHIGEEKILEFAVSLIATHASPTPEEINQLNLLRNKCLEIAHTNAATFHKFCRKINPLYLERALGNVYMVRIQVELASEILNYMNANAPLDASSEEDTIEQIKFPLIRHKYHENYFINIKSVIMQLKADKERDRLEKIAQAEELAFQRKIERQKWRDHSKKASENKLIKKTKKAQPAKEQEQEEEKKEEYQEETLEQRRINARENIMAYQEKLKQKYAEKIGEHEQQRMESTRSNRQNKMDREHREILKNLQESITIQMEELSGKTDQSSLKTLAALQEIQEALNIKTLPAPGGKLEITLSPYDRLALVQRKIIDVDKRLSSELDQAGLSHWQTFGKVTVTALIGKIATATMPTVGIPLAVGLGGIIAYAKNKFGTHKIWSPGALATGKAKKSVQALTEKMEAPKESPKNK